MPASKNKNKHVIKKVVERREFTGHTSVLKRNAIFCLLIVIIGVVVYSNTFHSPFAFDDESNIYRNVSIKNWSYAVGTTASEWLLSSRSVGQMTFALNYRLHGLDVLGYHVLNLLIHLGSALLVYWLVVLTFKTPFAGERSQRTSGGSISGEDLFALFCALLFVSHPIQTQAVTYIVQRYTSLATMFYLLSLTLYIKSRLSEESNRRYVYYGLSLISAVLAMKTKEIAFTLPVIVVLYEYLFFRGDLKKRLVYLAPMLLMMAIVPLSLALRLQGDGVATGGLDEITKVAGSTDVSRWDYLNTQFRVIVTYIRLLFLPIHQNLDYDYPIYRTFFTPPVFLSFLFLLSIFSGGVYLLYKSIQEGKHENQIWYRLIAFGIFWFFVTLSVESSIIPILDVIFEHRLYLPSVGFIWAVLGLVFLAVGQKKNKTIAGRVLVVVLALIVVGLSVTAYARNAVWHDEITLWEDTVKKSPKKPRAIYNLYDGKGRRYLSEGRFEEAMTALKVAININPYIADAHNNVGLLYLKKGYIDAAAKEIHTALSLEPSHGYIYGSLGQVYMAQGAYEKASEAFKSALKLDPSFTDAKNNLEKVELILREKEKGRR